MNIAKPELIAPAGDLQKLKIAFLYGADAVYASTPKFSMRTREIGFTEKSLKKGIAYAHSLGKKIYLTLNTFPHSSEIEKLKTHARKTIALKPDAIIVADPGVLSYLKTITSIPIHLSTQANTTNYLSANFWQRQGVERIVLARELNIKDIELISKYCSSVERTKNFKLLGKSSKNKTIGLETFVHGAMCMAYSGRCQISNYMLGRDPNKGACAQPCRFKYKLYELEEEMREGEKYPVYEDENGTYLLNSKDLCMIEHIPELIDANIGSFKIEGRLKSIYYVAMVTRAYRQAIDLYFDNKNKYLKEKDSFVEELKKVSNRGFTTGFYFGKPNTETNNYETSRAKSDWGFIGLVKKYDNKRKVAKVEVKNHLPINSELEIVTPTNIYEYELKEMYKDGEKIDCAHADYIVEMPLDQLVPEDSFLRIKENRRRD